MKTDKKLPNIDTPWGFSQSRKEIGQGMELVSTAGHGGVFLSDDRLLCLPLVLRNAKTFCGSPNWFEEDIDAILPVLAFPAEWSDSACWNAVRMAKGYNRGSDGKPYPLTAACQEFLASPESLPVRDKAQLFEETNRIREKWERGSISSAKVGWWVYFNRGSEQREELMRHYPKEQFWTDKEIEAGRVQVPPMPPLPPGCASCADLPPRLTSAGEVSFEEHED